MQIVSSRKFVLSLVLLGGLAAAASGIVTRPSSARADGTLGRQLPAPPPGHGSEHNGEIVVRLAPGASADQVAASAGMVVRNKLRFAPNTYVLGPKPAGGAAVRGRAGAPAPGDVQNIPGVLIASSNTVERKLSAVQPFNPNDPELENQWAMRTTGAPQLWGITAGQRLKAGPTESAVVAIMDTAVWTNHPDLAANVNPNGFDFVLDQPYDVNVIESNAGFLAFLDFFHGTGVAGCAAAVNNNGEGISSYPWEAVSILPLRIFDTFQFTTIADIVDAFYYCIQAPGLFGQRVDVINCSFGGILSDPLEAQAVADCHAAGIAVCSSTGNSRNPFTGISGPLEYPASYPETIPVGAVGPFNERSWFSNGGVPLRDQGLVAPGGDDLSFSDATRQVLLCAYPDTFFGFGLLYDVGQGTSEASPHVAGAIATLITQGARSSALTPDEQVEQMRNLLRNTVRNPSGVPNIDIGAGVLDMDRAIRSITQYVEIQSPAANEITESFGEAIAGRVVQPDNSPITPARFQLFVNGVDRTGSTALSATDPQGFVFQPSIANPLREGGNDVNVIVKSAIGGPDRELAGGDVLDAFGNVRIPARTYRFRVLQRFEQPGLKLFSVPYELQPNADSLDFLMGGNLVRLARWLPDQNRYAVFDNNGAPQEPQAALTTGNAGVARPPIGTGFWARVIDRTPVNLLGQSERAFQYEIPLEPGFNLIGDPYAFRVPFNVCNVRYGDELMSIQDAADRGIVSSAIWRYEMNTQGPEGGRYTFKTLPSGELVPWEGHWVKALKSDRPITLIVPRIPISGILGSSRVKSAPAIAGAATKSGSGWKAALVASVNGREVDRAVFGATRTASEGFGPEDVACPPSAPSQARVHVLHNDWSGQSGPYAQDVRRDPSKPHTWTLAVETSRPGTSVKLAWDHARPAGRTYVQIGDTGQPRLLGDREPITVRSGPGGGQKVTLTVVPRSGTAPLL